MNVPARQPPDTSLLTYLTGSVQCPSLAFLSQSGLYAITTPSTLPRSYWLALLLLQAPQQQGPFLFSLDLGIKRKALLLSLNHILSISCHVLDHGKSGGNERLSYEATVAADQWLLC